LQQWRQHGHDVVHHGLAHGDHSQRVESFSARSVTVPGSKTR
jgi:hypothetical protein